MGFDVANFLNLGFYRLTDRSSETIRKEQRDSPEIIESEMRRQERESCQSWCIFSSRRQSTDGPE